MSWGNRPTVRIKGAAFTSFEAFQAHIEAGGYVFYHHKAYHPLVIGNWSFWRLKHLCLTRSLSAAQLNPQHYRNTPSVMAAEHAYWERLRDHTNTKNFRAVVGARTSP